MKKLKFLALCLALLFCMQMIACGSDNAKNESDSDKNGQEQDGTIVLTEENIFEYLIFDVSVDVKSASESSSGIRQHHGELTVAISAKKPVVFDGVEFTLQLQSQTENWEDVSAGKIELRADGTAEYTCKIDSMETKDTIDDPQYQVALTAIKGTACKIIG